MNFENNCSAESGLADIEQVVKVYANEEMAAALQVNYWHDFVVSDH